MSTYSHAELKLIYALAQWTVKSLLVRGVCVCDCACAQSSLVLPECHKAKSVCRRGEGGRQNWQELSCTHVWRGITMTYFFFLRSLIAPVNVEPALAENIQKMVLLVFVSHWPLSMFCSLNKAFSLRLWQQVLKPLLYITASSVNSMSLQNMTACLLFKLH